MKIAILGYGTVGHGVDEIVAALDGVEVAHILDLPDRCTEPRMTSDYASILADPEVELVLECMGGLEPAHTFIMQALCAGKGVVTSNKAVVAAYFDEFAEAAKANGVALFIEATTGGGIPWIASIEKARRIDEVTSFMGIMNGTTNFIVDNMAKTGADFAETLARAQELGYAEADPSADIDGIDVKNKTIISASVCFDVACTSDFPVTGIRNLTKADMDLFAAHDRVVKLLGHGVARDGSYAVAVEPMALPASSLEANVPSNFNLVTLEGATIGELKFYGQGAGSLPTGNAMVQDVLDYRDGRRPSYDRSRDLAYDPALLAGDYVFRTIEAPDGASPYGEGAWLVEGITAEAARNLLTNACEADPSAFMARIV